MGRFDTVFYSLGKTAQCPSYLGVLRDPTTDELFPTLSVIPYAVVTFTVVCLPRMLQSILRFLRNTLPQSNGAPLWSPSGYYDRKSKSTYTSEDRETPPILWEGCGLLPARVLCARYKPTRPSTAIPPRGRTIFPPLRVPSLWIPKTQLPKP